MKKGFVIIAVLLSVLFYGNALAVDDTDIQKLQTNVSSTKSKADKNSADIQSMKEGLPAIEERVSTIEDRLAGYLWKAAAVLHHQLLLTMRQILHPILRKKLPLHYLMMWNSLILFSRVMPHRIYS